MDRASARLLAEFIRMQDGWYGWVIGSADRFANPQHTGVWCCRYSTTGAQETGLICVRSYGAFYRLRKLVEENINSSEWRSQLVDGEFR